ncbi:hypothetical protein GTQ40_12715 [Flavobacteriaceae bacterium R38]|nr:hypothetical protein [Flavobacteriaceae bacterium R38]
MARLKRLRLLCLLVLGFITLLCYAQKDKIPFYTSDELDFDITMFEPNIANYKNLYYDNEIAKLGGYVFIHLDITQMWTQKNLIVNWSREGVGATGFDIVFADEDLAIKSRQLPSSGFPGGVILENHYYGNRADVLFTNPNNLLSTDTTNFSYPKKNEVYKFNKVYSHKKTYKKSHNVIIWPYVMAAIDWDKQKDIIMPGFSPLGIQEYYYRMIKGDNLIITDSKGRSYEGFIISGFRNESLEKLRTVKLSDPISRTDYYISKKPPYFLGKKVYKLDKSKNKIFSYEEILIDFNPLEHSYQRYLKEMLEISRKELEDFDMPWNKQTNK